MTLPAPHPKDGGRSPFAGRPVHDLLALDMDPAAQRPVFEDEVWDLTGIRDAPVGFTRAYLIWDFTPIPHAHWRTVVREFLVAHRSPRHERIAALPWARRDQLSLGTCAQRL